MAWQAVTDVNDGQSFGGDAWQTAIDAIEELQDAIAPNVPAWTSFTPAWANTTVGDGTSTGHYRYVPGGMWVEASLVWGSTTAFTGTVALTIPNGQTSATGPISLGIVEVIDSGTTSNSQIGRCLVGSAATAITLRPTDGTSSIAAAVPFTWASGDTLRVSIFVPTT